MATQAIFAARWRRDNLKNIAPPSQAKNRPCSRGLRTGSGQSGQTGPPLIVGSSSSHAPAGGNAGSTRNIFLGRVSCCSRCTTDAPKAFFSLRKMAATTSQACGRYICRFLTFSPTVHKTDFVSLISICIVAVEEETKLASRTVSTTKLLISLRLENDSPFLNGKVRKNLFSQGNRRAMCKLCFKS